MILVNSHFYKFLLSCWSLEKWNGIPWISELVIGKIELEMLFFLNPKAYPNASSAWFVNLLTEPFKSLELLKDITSVEFISSDCLLKKRKVIISFSLCFPQDVNFSDRK